MTLFILIISLMIILYGAELFTNGIEWLGKKLNLSEGFVGSVLAAVGTALPETMIPVIAILFGTGEEDSHIGIGAILGAPFMLSTLAMGVLGTAALLFKIQGKKREFLHIKEGVLKRDLSFFLLVFSLAVGAAFIPSDFKKIIPAVLILSYSYYVYLNIKDNQEYTEHNQIEKLKFSPKNSNPTLKIIVIQVLATLAVIIFGAHLFVGSIKDISAIWGIPAFILSLIIAPVATELPEKFNSIIWIKQGKDTLAMGNITGAMVFQSSLIPALGIAFTPWLLTPLALISAVLSLLAAGIIYISLLTTHKIRPMTLIGVSTLYLLFIVSVIFYA